MCHLRRCSSLRAYDRYRQHALHSKCLFKVTLRACAVCFSTLFYNHGLFNNLLLKSNCTYFSLCVLVEINFELSKSRKGKSANNVTSKRRLTSCNNCLLFVCLFWWLRSLQMSKKQLLEVNKNLITNYYFF